MRIVNLVENTEGQTNCLFEHGLCFYIETQHHKLLVDTGASDAFIRNAAILGIDLTQIDSVILSHGHYDHAGGVLAFADLNPGAGIYLQRKAVGDFYRKDAVVEKYIGIDKSIAGLPQVVLLEGDYQIDDELSIFSQVTGRKLWPKGNLDLKEKVGGEFVQDEFLHEQYLVVTEGARKVLVSGCAHNGVLNILEKYQMLYGANPDALISGFHMMKKTDYTPEDVAVMEETARELRSMNTMFYTGHCTGEFTFEVMKKILGEQLVYVHSGDEVRV